MSAKEGYSGRSEILDDDDSGLIHRTIERARWRKEKVWRRMLAFSNEKSTEPFQFLSRGRRVFDVVSIVTLVVFCIFATFWQMSAGSARRDRLEEVWKAKYFLDNGKKVLRNLSVDTWPMANDTWYEGQTDPYKHRWHMNCIERRGNLPPIFGRLTINPFEIFITYSITAIVHAFILLLSSIRCEFVFPNRKLNFKWRRKFKDSASNRHSVRYSNIYLGPTTRSLRELVDLVRAGKAKLDEPSRFLLSSYGRAFLNRVTARIHVSLQLYDDDLVRRHRRGTWTFFFINLISVCISMAAAYEDSGASDTCEVRTLLLAFLEKFSFTLLAAFAIASFAGVSQYSQLICVREKLSRLTEDEKFLISLIAANTDVEFRGVARSESSGYAKIMDPGDAEVFIPMHASLFAYKQARTFQNGSTRLYNETAPDEFGNYDMT